MTRNILNIICMLILVPGILQLQAQQFEVSPSKLQFQIEPGQSETRGVSIINKSDVKKSYILELNDWTVDKNGEIAYVDSNPKRSCVDWINISPSFFDLGPNESLMVAINMNVPDSGLTTKWAMLIVREVVEQTSAIAADKSLETGIIISPSIAVYLLQSPLSNNSLKAGISDLKEMPPTENDSTLRLSAIVHNQGDRILDCKVYLMVMDLQTAEETKVAPETFLLLPGVRSTTVLKMPAGLAPGSYSVAAILDYGNDAELEGVQMDIEIPEQKKP